MTNISYELFKIRYGVTSIMTVIAALNAVGSFISTDSRPVHAFCVFVVFFVLVYERYFKDAGIE